MRGREFRRRPVLGLLGLLVPASPAFADCRDEVRDLREEINDDRSDYTVEARAEARRHLAAAELAVLQPLECREHLRQARRALRRGRD